MLFKRIESPGLAHYSYLLGDSGQAVVIDPRIDCQVYIDEAAAVGMQITDIFETHRNEDYCIGSVALSELTGANIWHADAGLPYQYGKPVMDGQEWKAGSLTLKAMHTPGHTPGSISYVLSDAAGIPFIVFTGDTLFAGDVGRTDLLGEDRISEMTDQLFHSIHEKILPLGDGVMVCPAHGAGSACGTAIVDRPWTTVGIERLYNPRLQATDKNTFVQQAAVLERPPYFLQMERLNMMGPRLKTVFPNITPLSVDEFKHQAKSAAILDARSHFSFATAHIPDSLHIYSQGLAAYSGWFLSYHKPLLLIAEQADLDFIVRTMARMGFMNICGYLAAGIGAWQTAGLPTGSVDTVTVQQLCHQLDTDGKPWILDVRKAEELEQDGRIPGAVNIPLRRLLQRAGEIPNDKTVYIFCASGMRSMIAASLLQQKGLNQLVVVMGGFKAWNSVTCPIQ